jgi:hypothetical protein
MRKKASSEKQKLHNSHVNGLWDAYKELENELKKTMDFATVLQDPRYKEACHLWKTAWNTCPECRSTNTKVDNYDDMWRDGDVVCVDCGTYVRMYDAG